MNNIGYPDPLGIGEFASQALMGFAEFICALLVAVGLFTRLACIPIVLGMGVAFFIFHGSDAFTDKELSFLYLSGFLGIVFCGGGKYSLDNILQKANGKRL